MSLPPSSSYDIESYPNFALLGILDFQTQQVIQFSSEPGIGLPLQELKPWWLANQDEFLFFSFNGHNYDNFMVKAMMDGIDDPAVLNELSVSLINDKSEWPPILTSVSGELNCDLLRMNGGGTKASLRRKVKTIASLKVCGVKLNHWRLQGLPYEFDQSLSHQQMIDVAEYNVNDLQITMKLAQIQQVDVNSRLDLLAEFGIAGLSSPKPKIAILLLERLMGGIPKPTQNTWFTSGDQLTDGFQFSDPVLIDVWNRIRAWRVTHTLAVHRDASGDLKREIVHDFHGHAPEVLFSYAGIDCRVRRGGLHTADPPGAFEADDEWLLRDMDAESFYPAMILNEHIVPVHIDPTRFHSTYKLMRDRRLEAKAAGQKQLSDGLKVGINSVFGKFNEPWSPILDPHCGMMVTMRGQMVLLAIMECVVVNGGEIIGANTDGLMTRLRRRDAARISDAVDALARRLGFSMEYHDYAALYRSAGNDYIAVPLGSGAIKTKGRFGYDKADMGKESKIKIVLDAAREYLIAGTPIEQTLRASREITDFIHWVSVTREYHLCDDYNANLGHIARWYFSTTPNQIYKIQTANGKTFSVHASTNAAVCQDIPIDPATAGFVFPDDIDYEPYQRMAEQLVDAVLNPEIKYEANHLDQKDLTRDQLDRCAIVRTTTTPDCEYCLSLDLTGAQERYDRLSRGDGYNTMRAVLTGLWFRHEGRLTHGDLIYLMDHLDDATGYFQRPDKRKSILSSITFIAGLIPFRRPRTVEQMLDHAVIWATEHVERTRNDKIKGVARVHVPKTSLDKFMKGGELYPFICALVAQNLKHPQSLTRQQLLGLIADVQQRRDPQPVELKVDEQARQALIDDEAQQAKWRSLCLQL